MKKRAFVVPWTTLGTEKGHKRDMPTTGCSLAALRHALKHLYDPRALQKNPLARTLQPAGARSAPASLRHTLIKAIESLKPADDLPTQSTAWRIYEILHYRYVEQCSQEEVADQLGLSVRHVKREQGRAVEVLAERLGEQFGIEIRTGAEPAQPAPSVAPEEEMSAVESEPRWLAESPPGGPVELAAVLPAVLDLVRPIAARYGVHLQVSAGGSLPPLAVRPVVVRQILISLLCVAIRQTAGGKLTLSARPRRWGIEVEIQGSGCRQQAQLSDEDDANLVMALKLATACGGKLLLPENPRHFAASLLLPAAEQVVVLVIDDNPDTVRLLQRYATGTRYLLLGAQDPEQAFSLARQNPPQAIVLDVMMPDVDGWELLGRLKQHPLTSGIPVVACTILAQEELAISLGVSAFLRKPVNRRDFLAALDRVLSFES
jgi:CheY-like chemotaxis protein